MSKKPDFQIRVSKLCLLLLNFIEIIIPAIMLVTLLAAFIVGIIYRYIVRDPQSWTYELSSIAFLQFVILSACFAQREDEHIAFDMIYVRRSKKTQCIMRIVSGIIVCFTATMLIPVSIKYVSTMLKLKTQIMKLPRWCIFTVFPVTFAILDLRAFIRLILDVISLISKKYDKKYPKTRRTKEA